MCSQISSAFTVSIILSSVYLLSTTGSAALVANSGDYDVYGLAVFQRVYLQRNVEPAFMSRADTPQRINRWLGVRQ